MKEQDRDETIEVYSVEELKQVLKEKMGQGILISVTMEVEEHE